MARWQAVGVGEMAGSALATEYIGGYSTWEVTSCLRKAPASFVCRVHAYLTDDPDAAPNPYSSCRETVRVRWVRRTFDGRLVAGGFPARPVCS